MLIVGAKGFAKEVLDIIIQNNVVTANILFYDDVNQYKSNFLFEKFLILNSTAKVDEYFERVGKAFTLGIGNPLLRKELDKKFTSMGGVLHSTISKHSIIGTFDTNIGNGCNVLHNAIISNSVTIGRGCILYYNAIVTHDCILGDFVEISPSVNILGRCNIGSFTQIGANSTILPDVIVGQNVIVGAGSIVTKNVPDNTLVYGNPAKIIKTLPQIIFE